MGNKLSKKDQVTSERACFDFRNNCDSKAQINAWVTATSDDTTICAGNVSVGVIEYYAGDGWCQVEIMWEDAGITDYKSLGLYGMYSSSYCNMEYDEDLGILTIESSDSDIMINIQHN